MSVTTNRPTNGRAADRPLGVIVSEATSELSTLFRAEVELAKLELKDELTKVGTGGALLAGAGILGWFAAIFLSAALGLGLWTLGLPAWLAALAVGLLYAGTAAVLALLGKRRVATVKPPQRTIETLKEDLEWARNRKS